MTAPACRCTAASSVTVEWECAQGHRSFAALCQMHGQVHVAALLSGDIRCGTCRRRDNREEAVVLKRVNGKAVDPRLGRKVIGLPPISLPVLRKYMKPGGQCRDARGSPVPEHWHHDCWNCGADQCSYRGAVLCYTCCCGCGEAPAPAPEQVQIFHGAFFDPSFCLEHHSPA